MPKSTTPIPYPEVLKTMARFIDGTPKVQTSDVVTFDLP